MLVIFCFYLTVASSSSLWDRDEPRFARAAVEMLHTGDYLVPTFNGNLRADKPPPASAGDDLLDLMDGLDD